MKEISITKYGSDKELIPTFSPYEIYQYSDSMLKHLPKDTLKKIEKTLLYINNLSSSPAQQWVEGFTAEMVLQLLV